MGKQRFLYYNCYGLLVLSKNHHISLCLPPGSPPKRLSHSGTSKQLETTRCLLVILLCCSLCGKLISGLYMAPTGLTQQTDGRPQFEKSQRWDSNSIMQVHLDQLQETDHSNYRKLFSLNTLLFL